MFPLRVLALLRSIILSLLVDGVTIQAETSRWFMPGPLGYEFGSPADSDEAAEPNPAEPISKKSPVHPRAYLTRAMSGVDRTDGGEWARRNGLGDRLNFSHSLAGIFSTGLFETHPDFFPLVQGQRYRPGAGDGSWNPDLGRVDVAEFAAGKAREYFVQHPTKESFGMGVNDGLVFGESKETMPLVSPQKWFRGRPDYSPLVFTFMNRAAAALERTNPDKYLGALAYYWAENAPPFKVNPQVVPFLTADRAQGYDRGFLKEERALQQRWARALGTAEDQSDRNQGNAVKPRLGLYDYIYGYGFLIPRFHPHLLADNLRRARRLGFTDYYAEVDPNWGLDGPQPWLVAQLLLDPEQSVETLLDEYYLRYFGEAAEPMKRFFGRCEQQWLRQAGPPYWLKHYRNESQAALFPSAVCRELRALLNDAAGRVVGTNSPDGPQIGETSALIPVHLANARTRQRVEVNAPHRPAVTADRFHERVRFVSEAFAATECFVAFCEARDALGRQVLAKTPNSDGILTALRHYVTSKQVWLTTMDALKTNQPLAFGPVNLQDFTQHDPTLQALTVLHRAAVRDPRTTNAIASELGKIDAAVLSLWTDLCDGDAAGWRELCVNGTLDGPLVPPRRIANLDYGVALPAPWSSKVEPSEFQDARILPADDTYSPTSAHPRRSPEVTNAMVPSVLRIKGTADTAVFQWCATQPGVLHVARVEVRGKVGPSGVVKLTFGWLDAHSRNLGFTTVRLPEGSWREWRTLCQGAKPPAGAVWAGVGVRIEHQMKGDWVEIRGLSLQAPQR